MNDCTKSKNLRKAGKPKSDRPPKPYPDFPLCPHPAGYWCKSIKGKLHYFGKWGKRVKGKMQRLPGDGWKEALALYQEQKDDLYAGRAPRVNQDGLSIAALANHFLTFKKSRVTTNELTVRAFKDYKCTTDRIVRLFGKSTAVESLDSNDFARLREDISKTRGPVALATEIIRVRSIFNFAFKNDLVEKPVKFGTQFDPPSKKVIRKIRNGNKPKMFEATELRKIIQEAPSAIIRAMILIACNSGMGGHDLGRLPFTAIDLETGWIDFPREKTGVKRRFPLWPETIEAIKKAIAERPAPKPGNEKFVFLTCTGRCWSSDTDGGTMSIAFRKIMEPLGIYRKGRSFYTIRHVFETIGGDAKDQVAVDAIMGHSRDDMASVYRERISDDRLRAVTAHVRQWLFKDDANSTK